MAAACNIYILVYFETNTDCILSNRLTCVSDMPLVLNVSAKVVFLLKDISSIIILHFFLFLFIY